MIARQWSHLPDRAAAHLHRLCVQIPGRSVGSAGNRQATEYFAGQMACFGAAVETTAFECIDWSESGADLTAGAASFAALVSPYSLGCQVRAPLGVVSRTAISISPPST